MAERHVDDREWAIDGNAAERALQKVAGCGLCGADAFEYLRDVPDRASKHPLSRVAGLPPHGGGCKAARSSERSPNG